MTQNNNSNLDNQPVEQNGVQEQPKKKLKPIVVVLVLVIVACLAGAGYGVAQMFGTAPTPQVDNTQSSQSSEPASSEASSSSAASSSSTSASSAATEPQLAENPINFDEVTAENEDIYAWISMPETNINYPIVRHPSDNAFYLDHDAAKEESAAGAIFTEDYNTMDFKDGVTLVYGHNMADGSMFNNLHLLEDPDYFDANDTFYIYTPGHILTYRIVSAYVADDRHVLYRYNYFQSYDDLRAFEEEILDPHSMQQNTRDVSLDDSSKFVVLSTCNSGALEERERYLVCGVLVDDQPTE